MDPQYQYTPGGAPQPGNGMAVTALVLGIISLVLFFVYFLAPILGLLAVIFGALGIGKAKKIGGKGKGMAIAGLITGALGIVLSIILVVFVVLLVRDHSRRVGELTPANPDRIAVVDSY